MDKKRYRRFLWLITIICILAGISIRFSLSFLRHSFRDEEEYVVEDYAEAAPYEENSEASFEGEEFHSVEISGFVGTVEIVGSDRFGYWYGAEDENENPRRTDFALEDGVLRVTQEGGKRLNAEQGGNLNIEVPYGFWLKRLSVQMDAGTLTVSGIGMNECTVTNVVGSVGIHDCNFDRGELKLNLGDLEVSNTLFSGLKADLDMGNAYINCSGDSLQERTFSLKTDLGRVEVNGNSYGSGYSRGGNDTWWLEVHNSMGNISLEIME